MQYMGDAPTKADAITNAIAVVTPAIRTPELRDEVFCQLLKQMTDHPLQCAILSLRHGTASDRL
jgi:hypothetical protein